MLQMVTVRDHPVASNLHPTSIHEARQINSPDPTQIRFDGITASSAHFGAPKYLVAKQPNDR
jgi:hypothetical protein